MLLQAKSRFLLPRMESPDILAQQRLFMTEMSARQFETWPLRRASVVHMWSPGCLAGTPPPRDATFAAIELQRSVPGLMLTEVRPMTELWW
jgi:hypothetical protein